MKLDGLKLLETWPYSRPVFYHNYQRLQHLLDISMQRRERQLLETVTDENRISRYCAFYQKEVVLGGMDP